MYYIVNIGNIYTILKRKNLINHKNVSHIIKCLSTQNDGDDSGGEAIDIIESTISKVII